MFSYLFTVKHILLFSFFLFLSFFLCLFRATPKAYRGSQARGQIGVQLPAYTTAIAMPDLSHICDLHSHSRQCQILNTLGRSRDRTYILLDTGQFHYR